MLHSLNLVVDELARQVKRHRDKLRHRREAHRAASREAARASVRAASQPSL
jgi:ribosome-associated translation inhibitor RaiA